MSRESQIEQCKALLERAFTRLPRECKEITCYTVKVTSRHIDKNGYLRDNAWNYRGLGAPLFDVSITAEQPDGTSYLHTSVEVRAESYQTARDWCRRFAGKGDRILR